MRLDDGQADGDELAEELKNLLRGHHVLLPDDVLHPDSRGGLLAGLEQLGDVPPHLPQLQLPPVPQQLDPRDRQLQQRLALGAAEPAAAATGALEEGVQHLLRPNSTRRSERGENGSRLLDRSLAAAAQVEGSAPRGIRFDLNSSGGDGERWEMMRWRRPRRRRGPVYA